MTNDILKGILAEFDEKFSSYIGAYSKSDIKSFISKALEERDREVSKDICKMIDDIEMSYRHTTLEQWKAFKHIRNAIRDKYERIGELL